MAILTLDSLEFAKTHIESFYDSDFFPKPDEYQAIWSNWDVIAKYLTSVNIEKLHVETPRSMPAPKLRGGYRIVHQLEPLNAIVYTALARSVAIDIEHAREAVSADTAFSYRISISKGSFFEKGNGYESFLTACRSLAGGYSHVLIVDIADFYNRIYLHRVNGAICFANRKLESLAKGTEDFVTRLNGKASQGLPIGPAASIVFSEATMTDVDQYLKLRGVAHARYVDDIHIFSNSLAHLQCLEEDLAAYLFEGHRLQLAWQKSSILSSSEYVSSRLDSPQAIEKQELLNAAKMICDYGEAYTKEHVDALFERYLTEDQKRAIPIEMKPWAEAVEELRAQGFVDVEQERIRRHTLVSVLVHALKGEVVDLALARRALRRARELRVVELLEPVLINLTRLSAVLPDVFLYLDAALTAETVGPVLRVFRLAIYAQVIQVSRLARHWMQWLVSKHCELLMDPEVGRYFWRTAPIEHQARAARQTNNLAWIRSQKSHLSGLGLWDRRAVLMAASIMPRDESGAWVRGITATGTDLVEKSIAHWLEQ